MHCKQWIFDMDGTLTDSMVVVWEGAPEALLARFGRTPKADLHETLLTMGMEDGAQYLIREYALPLDRNGYLDVMREVIAQLYEKVELKPGVRDTLARLRAEGARMCICSNTWSSQCRAVLTRLGIDEYFDFYIEARGAMSKSSPAPFMEALHSTALPAEVSRRRCTALAAQALPGALCARTPFTPPRLPMTPASIWWAFRTSPVPPMPLLCAGYATSSCRTGPRWTGRRCNISQRSALVIRAAQEYNNTQILS